MSFEPGDRVYYRDNGPDDEGTVLGVRNDPEFEVQVEFDADAGLWGDPDWYSPGSLAHVDE